MLYRATSSAVTFVRSIAATTLAPTGPVDFLASSPEPMFERKADGHETVTAMLSRTSSVLSVSDIATTAALLAL